MTLQPRAFCLLALCAVALGAAARARADGTAWVVRQVPATGSVASADVMVSASGQVAVGFTTGGPAVLARMDGGHFGRETFSLPVTKSSFAMDSLGGVYFAAGTGNGGDCYGYSLPMWGSADGSFVSQGYPFQGYPQPTLALDRHGVPALVCGAQTGGLAFASFDMPSGKWLWQVVASAPAIKGQALCFDGRNKPVVGSVSSFPDAFTLIRNAGAGWTGTRLPVSATPSASMSLAPTGDEGVGFACGSYNGLTYGVNAGITTSTEIVAGGFCGVSCGGLAYDGQGQPAIVYSSHPVAAGPLYLSRRDAEGVWTKELLPVQGWGATLAFDAQGNPYVAAYGDQGVTLLSPAIPQASMPGDANEDGAVDVGDLGVLGANYGLKTAGTWEIADFNSDGAVDIGDLGILGANYGRGTSAALPEPAVLSLLVLGAIGLRRRR